MNENQIRSQAEYACAYLLDNAITRVRVAAQENNLMAKACFTFLDDWAEKGCGKTKIIRTGSFGYYDLEPMVIIEKLGKAPIIYTCVTEEVIAQLIRDYLEGDNPRPDLAYCTLGSEGVQSIPTEAKFPLFQLQKRIVLRHCGIVDPDNVSEYIAGCGGYSGLAKALQMSPADIVEEIRRSNLRERTGHGCPTASQWTRFLEMKASEKVVICNALDNDLQAWTARLLLEGDPHSVLEGLLIAAYTVGASQCLVTIPAGFNRIKNKLVTALAQMKEYGLLGENILDTGFSCAIEIKEVPGSMTAGEKTALLRYLEGKQAIPFVQTKDNRPELHEKPVLINHAETLANLCAILQKGAAWFTGFGTADSAGTKIITLTGAIDHPYTVEVPMGTLLETMIREIGGGIPGGAAIKAVQFGGPTGAYMSTEELKLPITYETLRSIGSVMGFGMLEVVADCCCAVEMTAQLMAFLHSQSCGKCVFCREGTLHMADMLKDITQGEGDDQDLELIQELGENMRTGSICGFGQSAANPILSSLQLFGPEFDFHIRQQKCPHRRNGKEE